MKALTGLPTQAYAQVGEEAGIPVADLLQLVQALESNLDPSFIARYRPDISFGMDETKIRFIHTRLREYGDLADRKIAVLTSLTQQDRLTPELRALVESARSRRELEDLFAPFKQKPRSAADDAVDAGLEGLARFLWSQQPGDLAAEAAKFVAPEKGILDSDSALAGAREIVARWLAENGEVRSDLRQLAAEFSDVVVEEVPLQRKLSAKDGAARQRYASLFGRTMSAHSLPWKQLLNLRRGAREGWLRYGISIPRTKCQEYLRQRLIQDPESAVADQLAAAAEHALDSYLAQGLEASVRQIVEDRCDTEAISVFEKNLRRTLMQAPLGHKVVIGIEASRPGGWRAAVVGPNGELLEAAIIKSDLVSQAKESTSSEPQESAETELAANGTASANTESSQETPAPSETPSLSTAETVDSAEATAPSAESAPVAAANETTPAASTEESSPEPVSSEAPETLVAAEAAQVSSVEGESVEKSGELEAQQAQVSAPTGSADKREPKPRKKLERIETPEAELSDLIRRHSPDYVVLGNGPRVRQVERFVRGEVKKSGKRIGWITVNEAGSWIYATSRAARSEFPKVEPAVRAAACLARRLQDPLTEGVKLDLRVLGIGQGHHDVDQKSLRDALVRQASACACAVGVDLNHAPFELLELVPGITDRVAKRIVEYREKEGVLPNLASSEKMPGMNKRVWEQAAGFFRVFGGDNPLDETGVHPDHYAIAQKMLDAAGISVSEAVLNPEKLRALNLDEFVDQNHSKAILTGIVQEFDPKRLNPRGLFKQPEPSSGLEPIAEPKAGMKVEGLVTNSASFGVFVDIGAEQDGLLHISQLPEEMVADDRPKVKAGERLSVYIIHFDSQTGKLSLSLKEPRESSRVRRTSPAARQEGGPREGRRREGGGDWKRPDRPERPPVTRTFGPDQDEQSRARKKVDNMSLPEKLAALGDKFRTKV